MNRTSYNAIRVLAIVIVTCICTGLAYFVASQTVGHQLATLSDGMVFSRWQSKFLNLVLVAGGLVGICSLIWFLLSTFVFKIYYPFGIGKRTVWSALAFLTLIISIAVPTFYSNTIGIKVNAVVTSLFVIFFTIINYWIVTIFTTPAAFKYTPLGSQLVLSRFRK